MKCEEQNLNPFFICEDCFDSYHQKRDNNEKKEESEEQFFVTKIIFLIFI